MRYPGIWRAGTDGHYLWVNADWDGFVAKWRELAPQGLRLTVLDSHIVNGQRRYAGVWRPGTDGYYLGDARWDNFVAKWRELADRPPARPPRCHRHAVGAHAVGAGARQDADRADDPRRDHARADARRVQRIGIDVELGSTET